jgi:hypothetical protein
MTKVTVYPNGSAHTEKPNKFHDDAGSVGLCVKVSVDGHTFIIHGTDIVIEGASLNSHLKQYPITLQKINRRLAELEKRKGSD